MTLLVLGASGLLGSNVVAAARERDRPVAGTYRSAEPDLPVPRYRLDLTDADRFRTILAHVSPTAVLNCAALTDVDECESSPDRARAVNADAPGTLARVCADADVRFAHVSTDYVFDGRSESRYAESADPNPVQRYGETKLAGERLVREAGDRPLVVRPSFVFGVHRGTGEHVGFHAWVRDRLDRGEPTTLFDDQFVTPSRAKTTARRLLRLLDADLDGTYHVACRDCVTPYAFGELVRSRLGGPADALERGTIADVDRPAERPRNTCLDVEKVEGSLGRSQPSLETEVAAAFDGD